MLDFAYYGSVRAGYIGTDPELFMLDANKKVLPAFNHLPAKDKRKTGKVAFYDGFQAEFITQSTHCLSYLVDYIRRGIVELHEVAASQGGTLTFQDTIPIGPVRPYTKEQTMLGCSPSENAYGEESVIPKDPRKIKFRTAGCHIHIGVVDTNPDIKRNTPVELIQHIDRVTGPILTSLLAGLENPKRRTMYGRAGEFRIKPYGFEYRTPSSAILVHPIVTHLTFDLVRAAFYSLWNKYERPEMFENWISQCHHSAIDAAKVINSCDVKAARQMVKESKAFYRALLTRIYGDTHVDKVYNFILAGATSKINPEDYLHNWQIKPNDWINHSDGINGHVTAATIL
jgi:Phage phiEco32-like COOH.NH2 ligase-type 2